MVKARYYKADGKKGRARPLPEALFGGLVNESVLHTMVRAHLANRRQGTGSARKPRPGEGRKPETVAAERDRPGSAGDHSGSSVGGWRQSVSTTTPFMAPACPEEGKGACKAVGS